MDRSIVDSLDRIIGRYIQTDDLRSLIKLFIEEKASENSIWSGITEYSHKMFGGAFKDIGQAAALTELIILALDIADDLQDQDNLGKPWMTCAPEFTLNALLAFQTAFMGELGELQPCTGNRFNLVEEVSRILADAINGQQMDLNRSITSEEDYLVMVRQKSGSLIRLACYMGYAFTDTCSEAAIGQMNELADCIGIMAQIQNDMNDVTRFDLKNDLLQKKRTLPVIYLLTHGDEDFPVLKLYYDGLLSAEQFLQHKLECLRFISDSGCIEYCKVIQSLYCSRAQELFETLPLLSPWKESFKELTFARYEN